MVTKADIGDNSKTRCKRRWCRPRCGKWQTLCSHMLGYGLVGGRPSACVVGSTPGEGTGLVQWQTNIEQKRWAKYRFLGHCSSPNQKPHGSIGPIQLKKTKKFRELPKQSFVHITDLMVSMEGVTSWISYDQYGSTSDHGEFDSFSEVCDEENKGVISMDSILPEELLERILSLLPLASIFRASCVCKKWREIVTSKRFMSILSHVELAHKPWYFMFTCSGEPIGHAYEPSLRKWYTISLPCFVTSNWLIASSHGLVCFMNNDNRSELHVGNPINKSCKRLVEPLGLKLSDYTALAISVDRSSRSYNISIVKSKQVPENFYQWELSVHVYDSELMMWATPLVEVLNGWRGGDESEICDGFLYFLIYSTAIGTQESRHGLIKFNLSSRSSHSSFTGDFIPVPCSLTCGRLINLKEKLVMVGGIKKQDHCDIIKGIGIWVLNGKEWEEVARMPHKYFQGFGEFDDVFASSGADDLIYIQSYGAPALLVFDMNQKQWKWSQKCPVTKRFPLQLFTGFCFEPRLEIAP
ncbi:hypothetical protein Nepgr_023570 [Nepenthes gracilis]|uniref:F-box domain-containing protein n=1 Tax=Nepenthes gracilis TaxID=150966 RepID=A0AAD3T2C8_NEPGR|nr:hypothetical protein Nepgr_023570 [Nepenthes gracilis]